VPRPDLHEIALAGPEHLDPVYVAGYDRKAQVDPAGDLSDLCARGLGPGSALVDLGAGTGTFAVAAAKVCRRVVAVDISPAMVEAIRHKAGAAGARNLECVQAGFLSYEHGGEPPDVIYTRNALHHLPDVWKGIALRRMSALLPPGGLLQIRDLVFAFGLDRAEGAIAAWLDAAAERAEDGWTREELETHLRTEHSTFTWLLEPMISQAGFEIVSADHGELGVYASYVCVKTGR
jgi:ubiquinone/menaquinone biosynthesis C-methylase UbiE